MRCLVTGATGFVGSHLVRWLLEQDYEVGILVRRRSDTWRIRDVLEQLVVIEGDLSEVERFKPKVHQFSPQVVFHLAWSGVGNSTRDHPEHVQQNLLGSLNLLHSVNGGGCQCWIGLGSQAEYGHYEQTLTENSPTHPATLYGTTKLCASLMSQSICRIYGIRFVWLRLFAAYGPRDSFHSLIPYVIRALLQRASPALTHGEQRWDYLFVEDAVRAIGQTANHPMASGIFNLGTGESYAIRYIVEKIRDLIDPDLPLNFGAVPYKTDQIMLLQSDITRLKKVTGWAPRVSIDRGLERTVAWYRENATQQD